MWIVAAIIGLVLSLPFWLVRWALAWRLMVLGALTLAAMWRFTQPMGWYGGDFGFYDVLSVLGALTFAFAVSFGGRMIWQNRARPHVGHVPPWLDIVLAAFAGGLAGLFGMIALSWQAMGANALMVHGGVLVLGLVPLGIVFTVRHRVPRAGALGLSAAIIGMAIYSAGVHPARVLASGARLAEGSDYCISLPMAARPALSRGDLTFLTMDKSPAWSAMPHAALVTAQGPIAYWSFHAARFRTQSLTAPIAFCDPEGVQGLSSGRGEPVAIVVLEQGRLKVPLEYHPWRSTGNDLAISLDPVSMDPAPDANPSAWIRLGGAGNIGYLAVESRVTTPGPHGLEVLDMSDMLRWVDATSDVYLDRDAEGRVTTSIECWEAMCLHRFTPNGTDRIIFDHPREELRFWRAMQTDVARLFDSFRM